MVQGGELGKILMAEGQYLHGMGPDRSFGLLVPFALGELEWFAKGTQYLIVFRKVTAPTLHSYFGTVFTTLGYHHGRWQDWQGNSDQRMAMPGIRNSTTLRPLYRLAATESKGMVWDSGGRRVVTLVPFYGPISIYEIPTPGR